MSFAPKAIGCESNPKKAANRDISRKNSWSAGPINSRWVSLRSPHPTSLELKYRRMGGGVFRRYPSFRLTRNLLRSLPQFLRSSRRFNDRVHHGAAETVLLHRIESGDGCAAGGGDFVFQLAQVFVAFERHARGSVNRLHRQLQRDIAGQTYLHTTVGECFHKQKDIGGAAAAEPCYRIEIFFFHGHTDAEAIEYRANLL